MCIIKSIRLNCSSRVHYRSDMPNRRSTLDAIWQKNNERIYCMQMIKAYFCAEVTSGMEKKGDSRRGAADQIYQ